MLTTALSIVRSESTSVDPVLSQGARSCSARDVDRRRPRRCASAALRAANDAAAHVVEYEHELGDIRDELMERVRKRRAG